MRQPVVVKARNFAIGIFTAPAGKEIMVRNPGIKRAINTISEPYLVNHVAAICSWVSEKRTLPKTRCLASAWVPLSPM